MFEKYTRKGTWVESLHIFLFVHLIAKKIGPNQLKITQYDTYELLDIDINLFNKWIDEGSHSSEVLKKWIDANAEHVEFFKTGFGTKYKPKVEIWSDREKAWYYKEKLQASFEFENFLEVFLGKNIIWN